MFGNRNRSKAPEAPTGASTLHQSELGQAKPDLYADLGTSGYENTDRYIPNNARVDIGGGNPYDPGDVREAMGFDRNDERVHVRFIPLGSKGDLEGMTGNDMTAAMDDILHQVVGARGEETSGEWPGATPPVTGTVTEPKDDERTERLLTLLCDQDRTIKVVMDVIDEIVRATVKHGPMHSAHEGASVIREEYEELWTHVKGDTGSTPQARKEALQLAAMAIRYVLDVIDKPA